MKNAACFVITLIIALFFGGAAHAVEYPDMVGLWAGEVQTVSSGEQVSSQVARGGAVIETIHLEFTVSYQDGEVFIGESLSSAAGAEPVPVWGAIRSTGTQAVFVTDGGGRGQLWFNSPSRFEFCFANQTPEQMSAYCAVLDKQPP
jgi:hypothetical protein